MFEKEAEELIQKNIKLDKTPRETVYEAVEFGYNKANEWHYVNDGDLPKDKKDMLMSEHLILLTKMKGTAYLNIALGKYNFSTQEFSYQHIVGLTDVIAWKEIVLPELKETK